MVLQKSDTEDGKENTNALIDRVTYIIIIACLILAIILFTIIGSMVLKINCNLSELYSQVISSYSHPAALLKSINEEPDAYNRVEESINYLSTISELNNSAFNNNVFYFIYTLITTIFIAVGGYIVKESLKNKADIERLITLYNSSKEESEQRQKSLEEKQIQIDNSLSKFDKNQKTMQNKYKCQEFYQLLNVYLDSAGDTLTSLIMLIYNRSILIKDGKDKTTDEESHFDALTDYMVKTRDCISDFNLELNRNESNKDKFADGNQINIISLKIGRIDNILNTITSNYPTYKDALKHSINTLEKIKESILRWKKYAEECFTS